MTTNTVEHTTASAFTNGILGRFEDVRRGGRRDSGGIVIPRGAIVDVIIIIAMIITMTATRVVTFVHCVITGTDTTTRRATSNRSFGTGSRSRRTRWPTRPPSVTYSTGSGRGQGVARTSYIHISFPTVI